METKKVFYIASILFIGACFFSFSLSAQNHGKIIPLVLYNPARFTIGIEEAFMLKSQYIGIDTEGGNVNYFLKLDESPNRAEEISSSYLAQKGINLDLLNTPDSLFLVIIEPFYRRGSKFEILGRKSGGKYSFRDSRGRGDYQSFEDMIRKIYGVPEVFRLKYLQSQEKYMTYRWDTNGLLELDLDKALRFLEKDYVMYQAFNPTDTTKIIDMFVQQVARFTPLTPQQNASLTAEIWSDVRKYPTDQTAIDQIASLNAEAKFMLMGSNWKTILPRILMPEQLPKVLEDLQVYSSKRYFYYMNMEQMYPAFKKEVDDGWLFLLSNKCLQVLGKLIFEHKNNE